MVRRVFPSALLLSIVSLVGCSSTATLYDPPRLEPLVITRSDGAFVVTLNLDWQPPGWGQQGIVGHNGPRISYLRADYLQSDGSLESTSHELSPDNLLDLSNICGNLDLTSTEVTLHPEEPPQEVWVTAVVWVNIDSGGFEREFSIGFWP